MGARNAVFAERETVNVQRGRQPASACHASGPEQDD